MDSKLQQLMARSNLNELIVPPSREVDLNQPVQLAEPVGLEVARSTSDPLQIHFATADIVGKLQEPGVRGGMRLVALLCFGGPMLMVGLGFLYLTWLTPELGLRAPHTLTDVLRSLFGTVAAVATAGFWPYLIYRRRAAE